MSLVKRVRILEKKTAALERTAQPDKFMVAYKKHGKDINGLLNTLDESNLVIGAYNFQH